MQAQSSASQLCVEDSLLNALIVNRKLQIDKLNVVQLRGSSLGTLTVNSGLFLLLRVVDLNPQSMDPAAAWQQVKSGLSISSASSMWT